MIFLRSKIFEKKDSKLDEKIRVAFAERIKLFTENQFNPILNNHVLLGERKNQRSINITGDYRLIFEHINYDIIRLLDIDTHHNLYGK